MTFLQGHATPPMGALKLAIHMLARAHRHRDPYTCHHQERVAHFAVAIGAGMGLPPSRIEILHFAALVHDVGKLGIPSDIVNKPGKLSEPEYQLVQTHCEISYDILSQLDAPVPIAEIAYQHHERLDGSGYPRRLEGSAICIEARILAVADTFDAMSSYRPYRTALAEDFVLGELQKMAGISLDREAVDACTRHVLGGASLHPADVSAVENESGQES